jgi:plastocyanin
VKRVLLAVLLVVACGSPSDTVRTVLGIQPAEAAVSPGEMLQYELLGATAATWSVVESGGGTISSAGLYTAPACPTVGTFHVSAAAGGLTAQAVVTVVDGIASLVVSPATVTLAPGQTQQFTATQTTKCGAVSSATMNITAPSKAAR